MPKTKLPSVDISPEQIKQMRWFAQHSGKKFNTWLKESLLASLPSNVAAMQARETQGEEVKEEAFRQLEQQDEIMGLNPAGVAALDPGAVAVPMTKLPIVMAPPPNTKVEGVVYPPHPCRYLKREFHAFWDASKCQGTCGHPDHKQNGSICHWPGGACQGCTFFAAFNRPAWQQQKQVPVGGRR